MTRILLVRHGETELQSSLRYWGKTDVALGQIGLHQAEQLRDRLAMEKIDSIYSSELKRAADTADIIAARHNLKVITCPELREVDFGKLEGLEFHEIHTQFPDVEKRWLARDPALVYPDGESLIDFQNRVITFENRLINHRANQTILIVAHAGVLRTLICRLLDIDMKNSWNLRVDMTSLSIIETYPEINMLCLFNDVSHLMAERNSWKKGVCPGLVPDNRMGRLYRDILGRANQMLAQTADEVFLLVAGIPMRVKPNETI